MMQKFIRPMVKRKLKTLNSSLAHFSSEPLSPSWVSNNHIFQKHPRLQLLHQCLSCRGLEPVLAYAVVSGLFRNPFVASRMLHVSTLFTPPDFVFTRSIFAQMNGPNVFSFNTMIKFDPSAALSHYVEMIGRGLPPDKHTFPFLLKSLNLSVPGLNFRKLVHAHVVIFGFEGDPFVQTALLSMYFACGAIDDALCLFDRICQRDVATWTAAISGLVAQVCHAQALYVFNVMKSQPEDSNVSPNVATMVSVMSACAGLGSLDLAKSLHAYVEKVGLKCDVFVRNSLIDSYAKCGSIACARQVFHYMSDKDLYSWTTMIMGLASHGLGKEALDVFSCMKQMRVVPDPTTFVAVLTACSHAGLVNEGIKVFESMELFKLKPKLKHYGCMVDLFSRAGLLARAYELVSSMPVEPNLVILGALLSACRVHDNLELAKIIVKKIEMAGLYCGGAPVLLSNMYADQNQWHEVVSIRESTRGDEGKPQGQSWIEVRGIVHEFGVEDTSHPLAREMHLVLNELGKLMDGTLVDSVWPCCQARVMK